MRWRCRRAPQPPPPATQLPPPPAFHPHPPASPPESGRPCTRNCIRSSVFAFMQTCQSMWWTRRVCCMDNPVDAVQRPECFTSRRMVLLPQVIAAETSTAHPGAAGCCGGACAPLPPRAFGGAAAGAASAAARAARRASTNVRSSGSSSEGSAADAGASACRACNRFCHAVFITAAVLCQSCVI